MGMWIRGAGIVAVTAALAAGCIDESDSKQAPAPAPEQGAPAAADTTARSTAVTATLSEWTIALSQAAVPHGTVSFEVRNTGTEEHAFEVTGANNQEWKTEPIKPGESATLSLALAAGAYDVYCPLASGGEAHADRGMKTTLTVQ